MKKIFKNCFTLLTVSLLLGSVSFAETKDTFPVIPIDEPVIYNTGDGNEESEFTELQESMENIFIENGLSNEMQVITDSESMMAITTPLVLTENTTYEGLDLTSGSIDLNGYTLTINGNFNHAGGEVIINGGRLVVNGDYLMQNLNGTSTSYSELRMTLATDSVLVTGNFIANSKDTLLDDYLTNGVLEIKGDLEQKSTYFKMSGTGKIVLSGKSNPKVTLISSVGNLEVNNVDSTILLNDKLYATTLTSASGTLNINSTTGNVRFVSLYNPLTNLTINVNGNLIYTGTIKYISSTITINGNSIHDTNSQYFDGSTMTINGDWLLQRELGAQTFSKIYGENNASQIYVKGNIIGDISGIYSISLITTHVTGNVSFIDYVPNFGTLIFEGTTIQDVNMILYSSGSHLGNVEINNPSGIRVNGGMSFSGLDSNLDTINIYGVSSGVSLRSFGTVNITKNLNIYGNAYFSDYYSSFNFMSGITNITGRVIHEGTIKIYDAKVVVQEGYTIEKATGENSPSGYLYMQSNQAYLLIYDNLRVNGSVNNATKLASGTIEVKGNVLQVSEYFEIGTDLYLVFSGAEAQTLDVVSRIHNLIINNKDNTLFLAKRLYTNSIYSPKGIAILKSPNDIVRLYSGSNDYLRISNTLLTIKGTLVYEYNDLGYSMIIDNKAVLNVEKDLIVTNSTVYLYDGALIVGNDLLLQKEDGTSSQSAIRELSDSSYIYVDRHFIANGGRNYFEKGLLEVKGDLTILKASNFYPGHTVYLTGDGVQTFKNTLGVSYGAIENLGHNKPIEEYSITPANAYIDAFDVVGYDKPLFPNLPDNYLNKKKYGLSHAPSGNFSYSETDMSYSAPGSDITLGRTYNSDDKENGLFGKGWHFSYESKITLDEEDESLNVQLPNGSIQIFVKTSKGYVAYDSTNKLILTGYDYVITTKDLDVYRYDLSSGRLYEITDRYGNKITLNVLSDGKITSITDQVGRVSTISYGSNGFISKIVDPMGREVIYSYTDGKLISVKDPAGEMFFYEYDAKDYLNKIKGIDGTVLQSVTYEHESRGRVLSKTNALGNTVSYYYDDFNKTVQVIDSTGRTSSLGYDNYLEITSKTDAEGKTSTTTYNTDVLGRNLLGQVKETSDRNGNTTKFGYDPYHNPTSVVNALSQEAKMVYDRFNNVTQSTDVDGNKSYFIYSTDGVHLLKAVTPINGTDVYQGVDDKTKFIITTYEYYGSEYLAKGLLKSVTSPEGLVTTYTYDDYGYIKTTTIGSSTVTTNNNLIGWTTSSISANGYETTIDYDLNGRVVRTTDDAGHVSRIVYDNKGNKIQEMSPNEYNAIFDNLITNAYSDSTAGIRSIYHDNGLVQTVIDALGNQVSYTYDIIGNKLTETKPNGSISIYEYDNLNRVKKVYFKDNASSGAILTTETTYTLLDGGQSQVSIKNYQDYGIGSTTVTTYDKLGRAIKTVNPDGSIYQVVYNENGSVQKEIDPKGTEITYVYDKLGRVIEKKVPFDVVSGTTYYLNTKTAYDNDGKVLYTETLNNLPGAPDAYSKTVYKYNALGQVEAIILYDGSNVENITQFYYDAEGRKVRMYTGLHELLTITDLDVVNGIDTEYSVTKYEYDHKGQMTKLINPMGFETTYVYDKNGNLIESVDPNGTIFNYEYNLNGNLLREYTTTLSDEGEIDYSYTYDNLGNRLTMVDANKTTTYVYNEKAELVSETDTLGTEKLYTYDLAGNRKSMVAKFNGNVVQNVTYNYDNMGRLIEVLESGNLKTTYTYDINGNRATLVNANGTRSEYTYNFANSLKTINNYSGQTSVSGESYAYYLSGNISEKTDQSGRKTTYVYDDLGRLKTETVYQNNVETIRINYLYDDYNNRISKQVVTPTETYSIMYYYDDMNRLESTYSSKDGTTTYTYDNNGNTLTEVSTAKTITYEYNSLNELISTNDGNKNVTFAYDGNRLRISKSVDGTTLQFLNDRDSVIAEILGTEVTASYLRGINLIAMVDPQGEFEWYYHFNYHGDVTELTDATGTVLKSYKYDAFGIEENIDPTDINPFRYTAEYFDKETGTIYLRARYYNPEIGRFINQDSYLGNQNDPLSLNLYTYTHNNPVMSIDPSGHYRMKIVEFLNSGLAIGFGDTIKIVYSGKKSITQGEDYANKNNLTITYDNIADAYRHFSWNYDSVKSGVSQRDVLKVTTYHEEVKSIGKYPNGDLIFRVPIATFMDINNNYYGVKYAKLNNYISLNEAFNNALNNGDIIISLDEAIKKYKIPQDSIIGEYVYIAIDKKTGKNYFIPVKKEGI